MLKQQSFVTNHKNALEVGTFCTTKDNYHCYFLKNGLISIAECLTEPFCWIEVKCPI